jgi:hypothetical protein
MIKGIFIVNNNGKARLVKCYERMNEEQQAALVREIYSLLSKRSDSVCNFLEGSRCVRGRAWREATAAHGQPRRAAAAARGGSGARAVRGTWRPRRECSRRGAR